MPKGRAVQNPQLVEDIKRLSDGKRRSKEIAEALGTTPKYVQKVWKRHNLPRQKKAPPNGPEHPNWKGGRIVDRDGYVLVRIGPGHPTARYSKGRNFGLILEHRLVMEQSLGRYLTSDEVVDHIDGNKLNNRIENLRLFATNADHLRETLCGRVPRWSPEGRENILLAVQTKHLPEDQRPVLQSIDIYDQSKKQGDVRSLQILRARAQLGKDDPSLSGMERYLPIASNAVRVRTKKQDD